MRTSNETAQINEMQINGTEAINEANRYNRQQMIEGWNQEKLSDATVSIIGSDVLAQYIAMPLAALGIGNIRIISDERARGETFLDMELKGDSRAATLEEKLNIINPNIDVIGITSGLVSECSKYFLEKSSLIIDSTNEPRSKAIAQEYAIESKTPLITASSMLNYGKITLFTGNERDIKYLLHEFDNLQQDEFIGMVLGGLIAEESKKILMEQDNQLAIPLYYNLTNNDRFVYAIDKKIQPREIGEFNNKKILMIGAGALGNFAGLGLARLGAGRIDIIDPDKVEDTNLNRQVLYYDSVGKLKAEALSEKIEKIGRGFVKSKAYADKFTEKSDFRENYDLIMECVDNFTARAVISDYAIANKIPLISGGTDYKEGQVAVYAPGRTSCMDCQLNIYELGKRAEERRRQSCIQAPNPSVIMTNQIIGGMMVNEAKTIFTPKKYGHPINGNLKYNSTLESRLGINRIKGACKCRPKGGFSIK